MKNLCESCWKAWSGEEDGWCRFVQKLRESVDGELNGCRNYVRAVIIEKEDDGTKRCSCCGNLWTGWNICPGCGADFRREDERKHRTSDVEITTKQGKNAEITRIITVQLTQIEKGENAKGMDDIQKRNLACYIAGLFDGKTGDRFDDVKVAGIQEFIK